MKHEKHGRHKGHTHGDHNMHAHHEHGHHSVDRHGTEGHWDGSAELGTKGRRWEGTSAHAHGERASLGFAAHHKK